MKDIRVIALEETANWHLAAFHGEYDAILGIYWYDATEVTHCCEITPSYYLRFLEYQVRRNDGEPVSDALMDVVSGEFGEGIYVHCRTIEAMIERKKSSGQYVEVGDMLDDYGENWEEEVQESLSANCVL